MHALIVKWVQFSYNRFINIIFGGTLDLVRLYRVLKSTLKEWLYDSNLPEIQEMKEREKGRAIFVLFFKIWDIFDQEKPSAPQGTRREALRLKTKYKV